MPPPVPIARRRHRYGIPERLDFRGQVVTPLDEEAVREAVRRLRRQGIESIAVCFLFSFLNPAHELRVREIMREEYPEARISLSHEVMPTAPEFERTSTTLVDAYVGPKLSRYLERLERALRDAGFGRDLLIMQSNGGIMTADQLAKRAVAALGSGPTGGVIGACAIAARSGVKDFVAIDMGGTSYEACLVRGGPPDDPQLLELAAPLPRRTAHGRDALDRRGRRLDRARSQAGVLRVGPESAQADPGPICYGRGGTRPTVTDANLVLGYLNPEALCGGEFKLTQVGVREAILEQVGKPLGLDVVEAAHGIFRIVNANMANAIRRVSSESGHDPRDFHMVVYGGNGPIHAPLQAEELGITKLLVPKTSPAFSALGLLIADFVVDRQRSYIVPSSRASADHVNEILDELEAEAERELAAAGLARADLEFRRFVNLCYPGQTFDMAVPARTHEGRMSELDLAATVAAFHDLHEELHAYAARDEEPGCARCACRRSGAPRRSRSAKATGPTHRSTARCAGVGRRTSAGDSRTHRSTTAIASAPGT